MSTQPPKLSGKGFSPISFLSEVIGELRKVTWPSRQESTRLTIMVLALSIMPLFVTFGLIMAVMIFLSFVAAVIMLPALLYQFGNLESSSN